MKLHFSDFAACVARVNGLPLNGMIVSQVAKATVTGATLDMGTIPTCERVDIRNDINGFHFVVASR